MAWSFFGSAMPSWMISRVATLMSSSSSGSRNLVGFGQERIGEERLGWQAALRTEVGAGGVDHDRRATGIGLDARHVREVLHHRAVNEACAAGPGAIWRGIRQHWYEAKAIARLDRKSTRLNSSHMSISYAVFCLKKKKNKTNYTAYRT